MPHSTYDMCCLPLILLAWSFVSWFVFKFQFWLWQWRLLFTFVPSLNPCVSCLQRCVLYLPVSRLTQMSNTSYWACLCPDSDFPLSFLSHSWTFPHEFVECSTMLQCTGARAVVALALMSMSSESSKSLPSSALSWQPWSCCLHYQEERGQEECGTQMCRVVYQVVHQWWRHDNMIWICNFLVTHLLTTVCSLF